MNFKILPIVVTAKLWLWSGKGAWHFVTIEKDDAEMIKDQYMWPRKGFGSIPVNVTIGQTKWKTSVFPEKSGTFLLPVKKSVRDSEHIKAEDSIKLIIEVAN